MSRLKTLQDRREKRQARLDALVDGAKDVDDAGEQHDRELTDEEQTRSAKLLSQIDKLDREIRKETRAVEKRAQIAAARSAVTIVEPARSTVVDEPRVYGKRSRNSWFHDQHVLVNSSPLDPRRHDAELRLMEWSHQVERDLANDDHDVVSAIEAQLRSEMRRRGNENVDGAIAEYRSRGRAALEQKTGDGVELRAITTGGGAQVSASGGGAAAFVSPVIMINDYAPYREAGRAFVTQLHSIPLPDYGMELALPYVSGPAGVGQQGSEGGAVPETDPTFGYLSGQIGTESGQVTVSQQSIDRTGPGFDFDRMIFDQLGRDYDPKLDAFAISQVLAVATTQAYTGTFSVSTASGVGGFLGQVNGAIAAINTAAGTFLDPTHLFMLPSRWQFIASWADAQGRQLIVPEQYGPFNAAGTAGGVGSPVIEGYTGFSFAGLPVFKDNNLPLLGTTTTDQAIVGDLSEVYWAEGMAVDRVLPQTLAGNLQVIIQRYGYRGIIVRYPNGVVVINGAAMAAPTF